MSYTPHSWRSQILDLVIWMSVLPLEEVVLESQEKTNLAYLLLSWQIHNLTYCSEKGRVWHSSPHSFPVGHAIPCDLSFCLSRHVSVLFASSRLPCSALSVPLFPTCLPSLASSSLLRPSLSLQKVRHMRMSRDWVSWLSRSPSSQRSIGLGEVLLLLIVIYFCYWIVWSHDCLCISYLWPPRPSLSSTSGSRSRKQYYSSLECRIRLNLEL